VTFISCDLCNHLTIFASRRGKGNGLAAFLDELANEACSLGLDVYGCWFGEPPNGGQLWLVNDRILVKEGPLKDLLLFATAHACGP
jgi:hypothetical protein